MLNALRTPTTSLSSQFLASRPGFLTFAHGVRVHPAKSYATEAALPSTSPANPINLVGKGKKTVAPVGPLRPHLGIEVNPNHGLWAFFRKTAGKDGVLSYVALEKKDNTVNYSGRAWSAAELRRKSFKDLHTLWYVVLRERNLLETQLLEANRLGAILELTPIKQRVFRCRKTMARIKYVINERRVAYEGAVQLITEGNEPKVLTETAQSTLMLEEEEDPEVPEPKLEVRKVEEPVHRTAAERAAAGLVQPHLVRK